MSGKVHWPCFFWLLMLALNAALCAKNVNRQQLKTIESYMDLSADPCEDYYQYACGRWANEHKQADYLETIGLIDHKANKEFEEIFEKLQDLRHSWQHHFVNQAYDYYSACVAVESYEPLEYLKWLTEHEQIVWPPPLPSKRSSRKFNSSNWDWLRMLAVLRKYGLNGVLLEQTIIQNREHAPRSLIDLDKPVLRGGFQPMYFKGFQTIMEYLGVTDERKSQQLWNEVTLFEGKLKSLEDIEDDEGYVLQTVAQLNSTWLERYLSIVLEVETLDADMQITTQNLPYMQAMREALAGYSNEFVCRYLMIRFMWHLNLEGPRNFMQGDCIEHTRQMLPLAMHWLYEKFNAQLLQEASPDVEALFQKLLLHFKQTLNENANRFSSTVLRFLRGKVETMKIKINNLPRSSTVEVLEQFYHDLSINRDDFYSSHLQLLHFFTKAKIKQLHTELPQDESFFHLEDAETGSSSSPYYLLRSNVVIVPLTLLHAPIYEPGFQDVFKYSALGFLLAHEITHGFDDSGVEFDEQGNMRGPSEVIKANALFDENLSCLRSKNPEVIDEKIADVSGLRWTFESYFENASSANERPMRWTQFPAEQLFFLNFAQFFCGVPSEETADYSEHGSDRERVLDALANFAEFGRVYNCTLGSRLHPEKKCQLWR